jgi:hypothetical protein
MPGFHTPYDHPYASSARQLDMRRSRVMPTCLCHNLIDILNLGLGSQGIASIIFHIDDGKQAEAEDQRESILAHSRKDLRGKAGWVP